MAGRPRKPVLVAKQDGDTRKRGANKHAALIAEACIAQRGIPDCPSFAASSDDPPETRRRLKVAKEHWQYLAGELSREGMLSTADEGMLTQAAMIYALAWEAFREGHHAAHNAHTKAYMQIANLMGLNESARAKFPAKKPAMDDLEAALCG